MTDIVELKSNGVVIYPKTHVNAVEGMELLKGEKGEMGPQGPAGIDSSTISLVTQTTDGLMSAVDKEKLDTLQTITFNKVGLV